MSLVKVTKKTRVEELSDAVSRAKGRTTFLKSLIAENLDRIAALQKANAQHEQSIAEAERILPTLEIKLSSAKTEDRASKLAQREELLAKLAKLEESF